MFSFLSIILGGTDSVRAAKFVSRGKKGMEPSGTHTQRQSKKTHRDSVKKCRNDAIRHRDAMMRQFEGLSTMRSFNIVPSVSIFICIHAYVYVSPLKGVSVRSLPC